MDDNEKELDCWKHLTHDELQREITKNKFQFDILLNFSIIKKYTVFLQFLLLLMLVRNHFTLI